MTAAAALVKIMERKGVKMIFGVPGAAILPTYDAIRSSSIQSYVVRHEQTAAFAADAYARVTGQVGVCAATSGPGSTNLTTGIYGAWFDGIPVIALTGQVVVASIGKAAFQEAPTPAIMKPITKATFQPHKPEELPRMALQAFKIAQSGKMGPVLLDLPVDVQRTEIEVDLDALEQEIGGPEPLPQPKDEEVEKAAELIAQARRPVLLAGGGVILANATPELKALAEYLAMPVVLSYMGKGAFPADHPLYGGNVGTMCSIPLGNKLLLESDLIIGVGNRFADRHVGKVSVYARDARVIHVNIDPSEIGKTVPTTLGVVADVKPFLSKLLTAVQERKLGKDYHTDERILQLQKDRVALARRTKFGTVPIKPQEAIAELRAFLKRDAIATHDCGISQIWSAQFFDAYEPRTYLVTGGAGTMGWGLGAAIAAKLVRPEAQVVNLVGDGSIGMSLQDLATAAKFNVPIVVYVLNNSLLGLIRQQQNWYYGRRWISTDLGYRCGNCDRGIDFVRVAKGMGLLAERVRRPAEIRPALERAFSAGRPYLLEVIVDPNAVCSMSNDGTLTGVQETE